MPVTGDAVVDRVLEERRHRPERLEKLQDKQREGLQVAHRCADILKRDYGVERVVLFGSLLDVKRMWWGSDIDLAVWGLAKQDFFRAGAALEQGHDFDIDLVLVVDVKPHILSAVNQGLVL